MKRVISAILLIVITSVCGKLIEPAQAKYSGGSGEPNNPYQIATAADLMALANDANDYNKCFIMTADIDLDPCLPGNQVFIAAVISPDTNSSSGFQGASFEGIFDGAGHNIINLTIDTNGTFLGLFGNVNRGNIKNLVLKNFKIIVKYNSITYSRYCGAFAGRLENSDVNNCFSTGDINAENLSWIVGGLVGENEASSTIRNSLSTCDINVGNYSEDVGGLVGTNGSSATISNCSSSSNVTASEGMDIGILVGSNWGAINNCFSTNQVTAYGMMGIGGLAGSNSGTITNCHSQSTVIAGSYLIGGLVGNHNNGNISECFSDCNVIGLGDVSELGGFVGSVWTGSIQRCYTTSTVSVVGNYCNHIGGFAGNMGDVSSPVITDCYSAGDIYAGNDSDPVGGFVGRLEGFTENCYSVSRINIPNPSFPDMVGEFAGSFSDITEGGINHCYFLDSLGWNNGLGQPLTDSQMKQQTSFVGWNFLIWRMRCEGMNYPKLNWQAIPAADFVCPDGVNFIDYAFFAERWLDTNCASNNDCDGADFDLSGTVDLEDLDAFVENWLVGL